MARINTNISSLIAHANLSRSGADLSVRLQRLATGLRINTASDDPTGLVVSERLRSVTRGLSQAVSNSERAVAVIATTEGHLAELADLLLTIKGLIGESTNEAGITRKEIEANQLQIDSALDSITRIANTASFAGLQLLDGSLEYQLSGLATSALAAATVYAAQFGNNSSVPVRVEVFASAQTASLFLSGNTPGAPGALLSSVTIEIAGNLGVQSFTFLSGTSLAAVVDGVNLLRDATGVSASLVDPMDQTSGVTFNSVEFGSDAFVSVRRIGLGGDFFSVHTAQGGPEVSRDEGQDVGAVVNGTIAAGRGLGVVLNTPSLNLDLTLTAEYAQTLDSARSFDITGGGATFLPGHTITAAQKIGFGIPSVAASRIGGTMIGGVRYYLDSLKAGQANSISDGQAVLASRIADIAINELALLRGRLGSLERDSIQSTMDSLEVGLENVTASESRIRDADFAAETAALTRAQILVQAGTSVLATANVQSQNVLMLLG